MSALDKPQMCNLGDSPRDDDVPALSGASPRGGVTLAGDPLLLLIV